MATRSRIGYRDYDGKYHSVYCHWDGYPEYQLTILVNHYNDYDKVVKLVAGGDMSLLAESCDGVAGHSYDHPADGQTIYYGRDRGEKNTEPRVTVTDNVLYSENYGYLFKDGEWYCGNSPASAYLDDEGNYQNMTQRD